MTSGRFGFAGVAGIVDEEAQIGDLHRVQGFDAVIFDRTIAPRDAAVVRYAFDLSDEVTQPLSIDARLRHRRHSHPMRAAACAAAESPRGRAFARASLAFDRIPIDACAELPLTEIGRCFGGRDHSTVLYSIRKVERRIELDPDFRERVRDVMQDLRESE